MTYTPTEPATLPEISYEPILDSEGARVGWRVPDRERLRFENGSGFPVHSYNFTDDAPQPACRELVEILAELDAWGIGEPRHLEQLSSLYGREPLMADRIAQSAVAGARAGRLHDPTAFLASRVKPRGR